MPPCGHQQRDQVRAVDVGTAGVGSPLGDIPTIATAVIDEVERRAGMIPPASAIRPPRQRGTEALDGEQQHQRARADRQRGGARVVKVADQVPELAIVSPPPLSIPKSSANWLTETKMATRIRSPP